MQGGLVAFKQELCALPGGEGVRPFLCQGSPFGCQVFLVGINPSTDVPLWDYWSVEHGCDKDAWLEAYRKKHSGLRPTRQRIELLCKGLAPVRALETNVFHHRSRREADLPKEKRTTEVFDFLLRRVKPRIVFVHGGSAIEHLEKLTSTAIKRDVFTPVYYDGITFDVRARHHLSYQCSYAEAAELGLTLKQRCVSGGRNDR